MTVRFLAGANAVRIINVVSSGMDMLTALD